MTEANLEIKTALPDSEPASVVCSVLRSGDKAAAQQAFAKLLAAPLPGASFVQQTSTVLLYALRRHETQLAVSWLELAALRLLAGLQEAGGTAQGVELVAGLVFGYCDQRLAQSYRTLTKLVRLEMHVCKEQPKLAQQQLLELLNLMARLARRSWTQESNYLLKLVIKSAWRQHDVKSWGLLLSQLNLHFIGYAKFDGFAKACIAYEPLHYLYLLLAKRALRHDLPSAEREECLQLALRGVRGFISNVARMEMKDDMEVFREWYQYLYQLAKGDEKRKKQLMMLLQLSIRYWHASLPKTSRKQVRYLEDLLAPNYVSAEYEDLLQRIV